ncbi:MAG: T9SS type A sorting domain-containing protein [Lentimicrobiaceae bacterium]|nr:T9SS type A sorting domain-containing protein [Lentimicrobiaceae bacterium]MBT7036231.1 T9SS type A sorting domain-containing protein [Lentimicrobiaceae bacterium]
MLRYTLLTALLIITQITLVAQLAITIPCEFETSEKLLLTWPYNSTFDTTTAKIAGVANEYADIDIIYNPDSTMFDTTQIRSFLQIMSCDSSNISFVPAYTNTNLLRQYSPITGYGVFTDTLERYLGNPGFDNYSRPVDDSLTQQLANYWSYNYTDYSINFEYSNIQYDGLRYLFVGDRILSENDTLSENDIRFALNSYFNSGEVLFLPNPEQSGGGSLNGLENYMKLIDFETILLSSIPDSLPDYTTIEGIYDELSSVVNYYGRPFNIVRIPSAPQSNGRFAIDQSGANLSYTNSIIINDLVIIPSYGVPYFDSLALEIYGETMPGYKIEMIDASLLAQYHSGLHTITNIIPQRSLLRILHEKITGLQPYSHFVKINCLCEAGNQVDNMWLYYKVNDDTAFTKKEIHLVCPMHFAVIEKLNPGDTVSYYIEANSTQTQIFYPLSAPEGNFTFWMDVVSDESETIFGQKYSIVPNPGNGIFTIKSSNLSHKIEVSIINSNGQLVKSFAGRTNELINLQALLSAGYYTIIVKSDEGMTSHKLIINN